MRKLLRVDFWGCFRAFALGIGLGSAFAHPQAARALSATDLQVESMPNPLAVGTAQPRLSWRLISTRRGDQQTAYRVQAASSLELLQQGRADQWDSGKIPGCETLSVFYSGKCPKVGSRTYWRVRVWDVNDRASDWSVPQWWETAPMTAADWSAIWIGQSHQQRIEESEMFQDDPAPILRKEFLLPKRLSRARVHVGGLGYAELSVNGQRVGDHLLDPAWTDYSHRVFFSTYDVTHQLKRGTNALGVMLGNGWFNPLPLRMWGRLNLREHLVVGQPRVILQLVLDFVDGTTQTIVTDESWRVTGGPMRRNSVYLGEIYDARREISGWNQPGFDDSGWANAAPLVEPKLGLLQPQPIPPIRATQQIKPVKVTEPTSGVYVFDFNQNFAGVVRLRVKGPKGTHVRLRYGELLYPDGNLNGMTAVCGQIKRGGKDYRDNRTGSPATAFQEDEYILKGGDIEIYQPRFTFHGFRYVEVTGLPARPDLTALEGLRLNTDVAPVGSFACSNPMFNRIQAMTQWSQLSNLQGIQSDCPHREKFGYGGDIVAGGEATILNFDMARLYAKIVQDLADAARPNGGFTETAPYVGISDEGLGDAAGPVEWGTAHPLLTWQLYQYYGNKQVLAEQYEAIWRWLMLLETRAKAGILDNGIGDHESLAPQTRALIGTAFYFLNAQLTARIARVLGKEADARRAESLAETIKAAFNGRFYRHDSGRFDLGTQAMQSLPLYLGMVPAGLEQATLQLLIDDIKTTQGNHLTTGIFGTRFMLHALAEAGRADVAYDIVNQRTFPGWGYMIENGATTLWEHWEFNDNTFSHNHYMFGSVSEWFYKVLAGIQPASDAVGFDKIVFKPQLVEDLTWVKASYNSVRGPVVSEWKRCGNKFELHVQIPVGSTAQVFIPVRELVDLQESRRYFERRPEIRLIRCQDGVAQLSVTAGEYWFSSQLKLPTLQ